MASQVLLKEISSSKSFDGQQKVLQHTSEVLKCDMKLSVYLPPAVVEKRAAVPVIYFLSGLTCTELNFIQKSGVQRAASKRNVIIVAPDTSPRGVNIEGEDVSYDFGSGAGFYVDATEDKWKTNYNMYSYITKELPAVISANFPVLEDQQSIMGHSMGGHGALICALSNPGKYRSVSAFSPIVNPMECPWGQKAFTGYLGPNKDAWKRYDACELVANYQGPDPNILVYQGADDEFLKNQLLPENFIGACKNANVQLKYRLLEGYDHSYYFISSYIDDHINHHADILTKV